MTPPAPVTLDPLPSGWAYAGSVTPAIVAEANKILGDSEYQYGDGVSKEFDGVMYAFRVEPHYDDHVGGYLHWHRGVSVWRRNDSNAPVVLPLVDQVARSRNISASTALPFFLFIFAGAAGFYLFSKQGRKAFALS